MQSFVGLIPDTMINIDKDFFLFLAKRMSPNNPHFSS